MRPYDLRHSFVSLLIAEGHNVVDVARQAGVSVATVSKVVNGRYGVSAATTARVHEVIADLGYETSLGARSLRSSRVDWVAGHPPAVSFRCTAKTRYRQQDQSCRVEMDGEHALVVFDEAQRAVTPGQSVVFYDGDVCLGVGVIEETGSQ